jgi:hypothetical protein
MIRYDTDIISSTSTQNPSTAESDSKNQFSHRDDFSNPISPLSSIKETAIPLASDIFGDDDEESWTLTAEELNMIMEVDAKIDHDNMLNAFRQSAAEAMVHREEELLLDKRFVAAEQAIILSHNLHSHTIPHSYKTAMSSARAAEWSKAIDIEINELQRQKTWEAVEISAHGLS